MFVLGSAGHVDHGKSSLIEALTGLSPHRLPEEIKREMTIDLNFGQLTLSSGKKIGIVDVPGHRRFAKNMISGVGSVDAFLFVVAADDGWMPQSEEHLTVLNHLGVRHGIGIVTKTDLVSLAKLASVISDVGERLGRAFGKTEVLPFSRMGGEGLSNVRFAIERLIGRLPAPLSDRSPRLWIDRVFVPRGQGIVVTGTLREGSLSVGQELTLLPKARTIRVKSMQVFKENVSQAAPNCRVALQISGIESCDVERGMLLVSKENSVPLTRRMIVSIDWIQKPIVRSTEVAFHIGTDLRAARIVGIGEAGKRQWARLTFGSPVPVRAGDSFFDTSLGGRYGDWGGESG